MAEPLQSRAPGDNHPTPAVDCSSTTRPTTSRCLLPKGPLRKTPGASTGGAMSLGGRNGLDEKPSEARGALALAAPPPPAPAPKKKAAAAAAAATTKKRSRSTTASAVGKDDGSTVKLFNSRLEPSPFLDSAYMDRRAKALSAMRQHASA